MQPQSSGTTTPQVPGATTSRPPPAQEIAASIIRRVGSLTTNTDNSADDDFAHISLSNNLKRLTMNSVMELDVRFFGQSSDLMLVQAAAELKDEYAGANQSDSARRLLGTQRPEFWDLRPVSNRNKKIHNILLRALVGKT